jgi:hypothetical protein
MLFFAHFGGPNMRFFMRIFMRRFIF